MKDGYTALMWAAQNGYQDIVSTLIASGARVDAREKVSMTSIEGIIISIEEVCVQQNNSLAAGIRDSEEL